MAPCLATCMSSVCGLSDIFAKMFMDAPHDNKTSRTILRTPKDYGMAFEDVKLSATDGCQISAWYIPAKDPKSKKVAVTSHQSWSYANKSGMIEIKMPPLPGMPGLAKQEAIDYVKLQKVLHDDGFHVVAYDQRNHGESEARLPSGWGEMEFMDAAGVMDWVNAHQVLKHCKVVLFPFCVAGLSMLKANAIYPEKFKNVAAWIATNLFTIENMFYKSPVQNLCFCHGGIFAYNHPDLMDRAMKKKHQAYIEKGAIKPDPNIEFTVDRLSAVRYAPMVKAPVLFCTPIKDWLPNQPVDAPLIFGAFGGPKEQHEFHWIGTNQEGNFKTTTNNRSCGYNFYQTESGSRVMLEFFRKIGV